MLSASFSSTSHQSDEWVLSEAIQARRRLGVLTKSMVPSLTGPWWPFWCPENQSEATGRLAPMSV